MPPRRPLPDLCLITALKFLEPKDQLKASKLSPRFTLLVRAANRQVKTLVITDQNLIETQKMINSFFISSEPFLQQLTDDNGKAIDFQPKTVRVNKWNSLQFYEKCQNDLPTVEEISTVLFSAVTSLVFISDMCNYYYFDETCQYLVSLLQHPHWATQLESLVLHLLGEFPNKETRASVAHELVAALNACPALQQLVMDCDLVFCDVNDLPALTVLAQLKVLVITWRDYEEFLLDSLNQHAANNGSLQIHLQFRSAEYVSDYTVYFSKPLLSRVVRLCLIDDTTPKLSELCPRFPSLTSLSLNALDSFSTNYGPLIAALSQHNRQLLHLGLSLDLVDEQNLDRSSAPPPRSLPTLTSVRAVTLNLYVADHSQVEWLCLPGTLPNCQAIHLRYFYCRRCRVDLGNYMRGAYDGTNDFETTNTTTALQCLREVFSKLYPDFQHQRITLGEEKPYQTVAELFAEK